MFTFGLFVCVVSLVVCNCSTIPSYIPVCKRNNPKIEECIIKAIEDLKPKLIKGIPELDIPALEPLVIPELVFSRGKTFKALCKNLVISKASSFKVNKLKADIHNIKYIVSVTIPLLHVDSEFDLDAVILSVRFAGKGRFKANATNSKADIVLNGKKVKRDGVTYAEFTDLDIDMKVTDYTTKIENFSNGNNSNKEIGDVISLAVNDNRREFMAELKPIIEKVLEKLFLDVAQKITRHFKYDDLFPEK